MTLKWYLRNTDLENRQRPVAVEIVLELEDWGEIRRIVEVAS